MKRFFYSFFLFFLIGIFFLSHGAIVNQSLATPNQDCNVFTDSDGVSTCNGCTGALYDLNGNGIQDAQGEACFESCIPNSSDGGGKCTPIHLPGQVEEGEECWAPTSANTNPPGYPKPPAEHACAPGLYCITRDYTNFTEMGLTAAEKANIVPVAPTVQNGTGSWGLINYTVTYKPGTCVNKCVYNSEDPITSITKSGHGDFGLNPWNGCNGSTHVCLPDMSPDVTNFVDYRSYAGYCVSRSVFKVPTGQKCTPSRNDRGNCRNPNDICKQPANPASTSPAFCIPNDTRIVTSYYHCPHPMQRGSSLFPGCERDNNQDYCKQCFFPEDLQFRCHCNSPGQATSGKNDFGCDNYVGDVIRGWCDDQDEACWEVTDEESGEGLDISEIHIEDPPRSSDRFLGGGNQDSGPPFDLLGWLEDRWDDVRNFFAYDNNDFEATGAAIRCSQTDPRNHDFPEPKPPPCATPAADGTCESVMTAFGTVRTDATGFITSLFGILLTTAGGIAVILIMRAGYRIMTARGNPEGIKEGREQLVAAIVGLLFLIFSFVLLQVIGVDLLRIPEL